MIARGEVRPDSEATVRSLVSGVVTSLSVDIGTTVLDNQEIARVRAPDGSIQVVTAPWRGTVTNLPVHNGDSVTAGSTIAAIGDVSRLRVETEDVDKFLVTQVRPGQEVIVAIDAIEGRELHGRVRAVALRSEKTDEGDDHYPVTVDLDWAPPALRPGMTVRVNFPETTMPTPSDAASFARIPATRLITLSSSTTAARRPTVRIQDNGDSGHNRPNGRVKQPMGAGWPSASMPRPRTDLHGSHDSILSENANGEGATMRPPRRSTVFGFRLATAVGSGVPL